MSRHYRRKSTVRTEQERGLRVETTRRKTVDLEALARVIVELAEEDPLHLTNLPEPAGRKA
jgi:hypothetical protein